MHIYICIRTKAAPDQFNSDRELAISGRLGQNAVSASVSCFFCCWIALLSLCIASPLHEARVILNSSDINYAGKLLFKLTCFGSLSPTFLLSWALVVRDLPDGNPGWKLFFPCRSGRHVSKTRGRLTDPAVVAAIYFGVLLVVCGVSSQVYPPACMLNACMHPAGKCHACSMEPRMHACARIYVYIYIYNACMHVYMYVYVHICT